MVISLSESSNEISVAYPLILLKGGLGSTCSCQIVSSINRSKKYYNEWLDWRVTKGRQFKALVPLHKGKNLVKLSCKHHSVSLVVFRSQSSSSGFYVRAIYVLFQDNGGDFQAPSGVDNSVLGAVKRIGLATRLLQSIIAETIYLEIGERRTFMCAGDSDGGDFGSAKPFLAPSSRHAAVWLLPSSIRFNDSQLLSKETLWSTVAQDLFKLFPEDLKGGKWLAILSCTRYKSLDDLEPTPYLYEDIINRTAGYCSLGAGGLALIGAGALYTWPEELRDLHSCLTDNRKVDRRSFLDDSAYRGTYWANFATSLGTMLHELGHCFDLDHTPDGIMRRGGDDSHLVLGFHNPEEDYFLLRKKPYFVTKRLSVFQFSEISFFENPSVCEPNSKNMSAPSRLDASDSLWCHGRAFWGRDVAQFLASHRWFQLQSADMNFRVKSDVNFNGALLSTDSGVRLIQLRLVSKLMANKVNFWNSTRRSSVSRPIPLDPELQIGATIFHKVWIQDPPKSVSLSCLLKEASKCLGNISMKIVTIDVQGQVHAHIFDLKKLFSAD